MTTDPFPDFRAHLETDVVPSRQWVECANCIEHKSLDDGDADAQGWAAGHTYLHPGHVRYRIVSQVGFSLTPTAVPEPAVS